MKKLLCGIVDFRLARRVEYQIKFAKLALGLRPDALFITCGDSRVAVNLFASTDPGDLFVVRNTGNLVAPRTAPEAAVQDESMAAAVDFAVLTLGVSDLIVCGHSECGAIHAFLGGRDRVESAPLKSWLRHIEPAYQRYRGDKTLSPALAPHNRLSQFNVLQQREHLKTYPAIQHGLAEGRLRLHGWWFDLATADVYAYGDTEGQFVLIDEQSAPRLA